MDGRGVNQRKPRRGRGSYGRARGQGASPRSSPSPSPSTATSPQASTANIPVTPPETEPQQLSIQPERVSEQIESSHVESEQQKPHTEEKGKIDLLTEPSHQFEKSVRVPDSSAVQMASKGDEGMSQVDSTTETHQTGDSSTSETEPTISSTTDPTSAPEPIQETPKIEKSKEEYHPRVLIVEPEPPRARKRSDHDPPKEIQLPPQKPRCDSEKEKSPSKDFPPLSYSYGLGGPVGKTGYIRTVLVTDGTDPWDEGNVRSRRVSSIAEVATTAMGFSKRQWITLFVFGLADLFSAMLISIQAPFYPAEAERKGATATEYGLVFGIFELVVFALSPIYGKYMNKIGPKLVYNLGIFTTGTACILFGLLDRIDDHTWFIALSFIIRICEAVGNAAFITASFTIVAFEFPQSVATTFASLETFFGLGLILGPTIGGALYQVGGYTLPFVAAGSTILLTAICASIVMPKIELATNADGKGAEGYGILKILRIPSVALAGISIMMGANSVGFLNATLEPHLRQFNLTPLQIGLVFIINGGVYALTAPAFGWCCDKSSQPKYITLLGAIFAFASFLLIGPAPFIPLETSLWLTSVGLLIHGFALGAILVSGFILALRDCLDAGFPDNISTYGVVSGLWTCTLSLGAFVGPSIGGVLLDNVGFRVGSLYVLAGEAIVIILVVLFILLSKKPNVKKGDIETQPLLSPSSPKPGTSRETRLKLSYGTTGESEA